MYNPSIYLQLNDWDLASSIIERDVSRPVDDPDALVLEAWSQGLMTGALVVMAMITYANMRSGVLLHKMILLEVM